MARLIFWAFTVVLIALATHLAVVLFTPNVSMASVIDRVFTATPVNSMIVLDQDITPTILHEANPDLVYAVCPFDIATRPLNIKVEIPEFYWSISVYSNRGDNIYTLNDKQAGVNMLDFRLEMEKSALDLESIIGGEDDDAAIEAEASANDNTVVIDTPSAQGVVLLRAFLPDPAYRARVTDALRASSCTSAPRGRGPSST